MLEGSGSITNGSESGSGRSKNIWIRIRTGSATLVSMYCFLNKSAYELNVNSGLDMIQAKPGSKACEGYCDLMYFFSGGIRG